MCACDGWCGFGAHDSFSAWCGYSFLNSCTDPMSDVLLSSTSTASPGSHIGLNCVRRSVVSGQETHVGEVAALEGALSFYLV